ncbi:MAG: UvrD-helicase domain-containing protein, partial [Rudaea sp.]
MSILSLFTQTKEQYKAATLPCDLSVGAGAGSGKTDTLAARYLYLTEREMGQGRSTRLTAITFTDRAAREMRNRIRSYVQKWAGSADCPAADQGKWQDIAADMDAARIGTIHSLCASILRAHPAEAGIDPRFDVLEEGRAAALQAQALDDTLAWVVNRP